MLSLTLVLEIRRLLDEGELSQRDIAAQLSVSRGSVSAVANGHRALDPEGARDVSPRRNEPKRLPKRCRACGGLVFAPCRLCRIRLFRTRMDMLYRMNHPTPRRPPHDPRRAA